VRCIAVSLPPQQKADDHGEVMLDARGGTEAAVYIGDQTRGAGQVRTLAEQVALESRTRTLNPKWFEGMLAPGISLASFVVPDFRKRIEALSEWLIAPPAVFDGPIYKGHPAASLRGPDGTGIGLVAP